MIINESSYYIDVYYDILDDDICLFTRYRFETKELAEQFIEEVQFVCTEIKYETSRSITGHCEKHPYRPRFSVLSEAIEDAQAFRNHYNSSDYKYNSTVFQADLSELESLFDKNRIKSLEKENTMLKLQVLDLETKLANV
jgi:hypothetical protein